MLPDASESIIASARRVGLAVDSCALLSPEFVSMNAVAVAQMRLNIGEEEFSDSPDLDYSELYRRVADDPNTRAWASAPKPDQWYDTINQAADGFDAVVCLTVAAGLSASYDSARVAAQRFKTENPSVDVRVVNSETISGTLKLLSMDIARAVELGSDIDSVISATRESKSTLRTIATLDNLDRMHLIANTPHFVINTARILSIKPVVTFTTDEFQLVAKPVSLGAARRRMFQAMESDIGESPARFVVLHVDAENRAQSVADELRSKFDCQFMNISDFHPFIGFYAGPGAVGIAWQRI